MLGKRSRSLLDVSEECLGASARDAATTPRSAPSPGPTPSPATVAVATNNSTQPTAAWLSQNMKAGKKADLSCTDKGRKDMKYRYKFIMQEVDAGCGSFICQRKPGFQFMDVCCSPGGFSEYVLDCVDCTGIGLTLPLENGGHIPAIDHKVATPSSAGLYRLSQSKSKAKPNRYHMHSVDVTTVANEL
eukprot:gene28273-31380_t